MYACLEARHTKPKRARDGIDSDDGTLGKSKADETDEASSETAAGAISNAQGKGVDDGASQKAGGTVESLSIDDL